MSDVSGASSNEPAGSVADPISVVIVDDHVLLADTVAAVLSAADDIVVLAVAATAAEGLAAISLHRPDVCLLDQRLPDGLGTDVLPGYLAASPGTRILLLTGSDTDDVLRRALQNGAVGFLAKGQRAHVLTDAVRRAAEGETVLSPDDLRRLVPTSSAASMRPGNDLTPREREILGLIAHGETTAAVAQQLFISPATVRNHIQSVLTKLGAHSKLEAVTIALREGLVTAP